MLVLNSEWQEIQASIKAKDARIEELEKALRDVKDQVQEILVDRLSCQDCDEESLCFTCGLLFSADEHIKGTLEAKG
jgi:hypothetical protein